MLKFFWF